jgi:hypothetical protein
MSPFLRQYLVRAYQRNVMRVPVAALAKVEVTTPLTPASDLIAEVEAELARIASLRLGASLAQRDFVSYQIKKPLEDLLKQLKDLKGSLAATEARDRTSFTGHH